MTIIRARAGEDLRDLTPKQLVKRSRASADAMVDSAALERKLLAAARSGRKVLRASRKVIFDSHVQVAPGQSRQVIDPDALKWIAAHDAAIKKLESAIALAVGESV